MSSIGGISNSLMDWTTGELVWFDPGLGHWLPGEILEAHKPSGTLTIQALINGKPQTFALTSESEGSVRRRQDLGTNGIEDLTQLSDLHEAALLWNLKIRYDKQLIYTYAGSILVAVNPYRMFDSSYGLEAAQRYRDRLLGELPPHLFAIGSAAHASLPNPQVVVISGESGSGKTESTKLVMQYLAAVAPAARGQALVTEQILEAAPLLEAFGNARTARNDNSSRFGKYLEVYFKNGSIVGAKVTQYLLEKSRIITQAQGERNYHVFYELLGGLSNTDREKYGLLDAEKYFYLNQGGGDCAPGQGGPDWSALLSAMQVLGVGEAERDGIIRILASVLHLGNIYFHRRQLRHGQEGVEVGSDAEIKWAAHLLQISASGLQRALTSRLTEARGERVQSPLGIDQALDARDAFAKALYSALFNWLVTRVNSIVQRGGLHDASRICLLDIFGFEDLIENSFEQLCINYASESLQLYFNKHVFKLEQQEYARERLEWTNMGWTDNSPIIHLLGKKPVGILHLLDDESNFPRASDASFLEKCHYNHALNEHYCRPRVGGHEFGIRHFAGQVWYSVEGFLDKNRDALRLDVVELLASSREPLVNTVARPLLIEAQSRTLPRSSNGRFVTMKPRTPTVAARFSDSLQQLLESMGRCNPWFIRCIKPNSEKAAMKFDMPVVLQQLRYSGMLETIKIRQCGYPIRIKFQHFVERFRYLLSGKCLRGAPYRDLCRSVLDAQPPTGAPGPDYQLGATRVFLREALHRRLEAVRAEVLRNAAVTIQKHIRRRLARRKYLSMKKAALSIQKNWRGHKQRKEFMKLRKATVKAQALYRGKIERKRYAYRKKEWMAQKDARERAKQRAVRDTQRAAVHHLEIPAELAFIFSKLEGFKPAHTERNLIKVVGGVTGTLLPITLPPDLEQFTFGKFCSVYFKGSELGVRREPITAPFLSKAAARDQDFHDSVALFKLILRWSNDPQLNGAREKALADYVAHKGLGSRGLRDELLVQLCNQAWKNDQAERIWQLMAHCLSSFAPSPSLGKYLLKFISDHAASGQKSLLQRKLVRSMRKAPRARSLPPSLLEWRSIRHHADMALPVILPDGQQMTIAIDSWSTCDEVASAAISSLNVSSDGWSIVLDDSGYVTDTNGYDYVLDLISELELCPAFPAERSELLKVPKKPENSPEIKRPQAPPPAPPVVPTPRKISREAPVQEVIQRKSSQEILSRNSALNERYFENERTRSRSLDNLLDSSSPALSGLGLSQSKLNERYRSSEKLNPIEPVLAISNMSYKQEMDFEYPDISSVGAASSNRGSSAPRYIKSQYAGKKAPPGSHSSRAHIEKSEPGARSSALSDTSEAPSLASHVRRVRVPSQASDVDQFLDELFSPVLDGNLDELSDARSLAASIRGGGQKDKNYSYDKYLDDFFKPITIDSSLKSLTDNDNIVDCIKGGGTKPQHNGSTASPAASFPYSPIAPTILSPQPLMMPIIGTQPAENGGFMPIFNMQGINMPTNGQSPDSAAYQQNLQRAFLQSAMAQNIQIQQQLLAQNQALQQLLTQQNPDMELAQSPVTSTPVSNSPNRRLSSRSGRPTPPIDLKIRKASNDSSRGGVVPPPPPPMPPPLNLSDPSEVRPFLDPYGRAKTVRIGKWRWPPPQDGNAVTENGDFMQFKINQQRKMTPSKEQHSRMNSPNSPNSANSPDGNDHHNYVDDTTSSVDWDELDMSAIDRQSSNTPGARQSSRRSFEVGASRPTPGSVGKLKLSSEMRQRLEQVTANHSVRSTSNKEKPQRTVNKLEDTRRMMLEQQLAGANRAWDTGSTNSDALLHAPPPPPPPVGPTPLPPAPSGPAPPPPVIRPPEPPSHQPPVRESYMTKRQDHDTFGVHQTPNNLQRSSFSSNWDMQSDERDLDHLHGQQWDHEGEIKTSASPQRNESKWSDDHEVQRPTFRTHQMNRSIQERERKSSAASTVQTQNTDKHNEKIEIDDWPDFLKPVMPAPIANVPKSPSPNKINNSQEISPAVSCITYNRVNWSLHVRKEVFTPAETLNPPQALHLIFLQIVKDVYNITPCLRITDNDKRSAITVLQGYGVTPNNLQESHRTHVKKHLIELARSWPLYFSRLFIASAAPPLTDVQIVSVSHWGIHLVRRDSNNTLRIICSWGLAELSGCSAPRPATVCLDVRGHPARVTLHTTYASQLTDMINKFCNEYRQIHPMLNQQPRSNLSTPVTSKADDGKPQHLPPGAKPAIGSPASNGGAVATAVAAAAAEVRARSPLLRNSSEPPASPPPPGGKHSLLQFAMQHFNNSPELEVLKMDASIKSKEKRKEWTWKQQTDLVKWQGTPLTTPLLRLESLLVPLALECFECILRYCGDLPPGPNGSPDEVRCVYTVLMHCHKHIPLRDEVYCQLMKQTTSNKSTNPDSCQRAWRLLSIVAAYFACSDSLTPFLSEHLSAAAADKRRACHGTAAVCLANLRKTQRCGGRKNVPSVEEVTAVSAGRSARRQIYRLPGGAERVVNTRCSTVVADVITELCNVIGVNEESEQQEFSLYCIVQGDAFTMPLAADEYILDVTTELHKAAQPFYLIFCRSVWYHPLRQDATPFYTEVLFNQVAPDYLEGLLLRLGNGTAPTPSDVRDMALVAALLHRAADLQHVPALKEVKFLLPRPVLGLREPSPQQWLGLVQNAWPQVALLSPTISKRQALHVLATWPLFGSSFFAVKRVVGPDAATWRDHILALNRNGVHFLDLATHETVQHWPFAEVISTRKVRSEDGALFLDMKCGSLLQQRVTRLQTEQAHEISRLVRQYITLEQANAATNGL